MQQYRIRKIRIKKILIINLIIIFILLNIVAIFHAYKFTHFSDDNSKKQTKSPGQLSTSEKIKALFFGVDNPKPQASLLPDTIYQSKKLSGKKTIAIWEINIANPKGTIILCHGYGGEKSSLLQNARHFNQLGYNTILMDFMGAGESEGNQTTIGYFESENVKTVFDYANKTAKNIILYGNSMGAASIMHAIAQYKLNPKAIILECPFGTMEQTVKNRFHNMGIPTFPMAHLLLFWGGTMNSFWAYNNNPEDYAKSITQPTLLMYGAKDKNVLPKETNTIFENIPATNKTLKIFPEAGHENYKRHHEDEWDHAIMQFLGTLDN